MPQFTKQSTRPMRPDSYRVAARRLRKFADKLDARAEAITARDKASLTSCINGLAHFAKRLSCRHRQ